MKSLKELRVPVSSAQGGGHKAVNQQAGSPMVLSGLTFPALVSQNLPSHLWGPAEQGGWELEAGDTRPSIP